jgi:hypothetical protein
MSGKRKAVVTAPVANSARRIVAKGELQRDALPER